MVKILKPALSLRNLATEKAPKRSKSSYEHFMKYVKTTPNGGVDVSQILSLECYTAWVLEHAGTSIQPEEAFRLAVTSQCQGIACYRPFPPDVETALLGLLRERKVWNCFKNTNIKIGKKGFKAAGFWEKKRLNGELVVHAERSGELQDYTTCVNDNYVRDPEHKVPIMESDVGSQEDDMEELLKLVIQQTDNNTKILQNLSILNPKALVRVKNADIEHSMQLFHQTLQHESESIRQMAAGLYALNGHNIRSMLASFVRRMGVDVFDMRNLKQLETLYSQNHDFLCSREFLLPSKPYQKFDRLKPIGCCLGDTVQFITLETDEVAQEIYGGDISGKHSMEMRINEYHPWMYSEEMLMQFVTKGEVWTRTLERRFDGTPLILLNRFCRSPVPTTCYCFIQDITSEFGHYLHPSVFEGKDCLISKKRQLVNA
mmetsp:Transcript_20851/g.25289  ORF Transcript_20851/g.25289 Transcript_20851/m.25289 type:complete len:430 (+) Transcript_20851:287-1576(+)